MVTSFAVPERNSMSRLFCSALALLVTLSFTWSLSNAYDDRTSRPQEGIRSAPPGAFALTNAKLILSPSESIDSGTLLIDDGKIVGFGADLSIPEKFISIEMGGKWIYPGFFDAYSEKKLAIEKSKSGYWNGEITPEFSVADKFEIDRDENAELRSQGIVARLIAPHEGIIRGRSAIVATGDGSRTLELIARDSAMHARLTLDFRKGSRDQYPNSPMGAVALARQAFYDADWYRTVQQLRAQNSNLPEIELNQSLAVLGEYPRSNQLVLFSTPNELFSLRAHQFAKEFQLRAGFVGSGKEYRRLNEIAAANVPVIIPLNFPKAPNVLTYESAREASLESLMHWNLAPENPAKLAKAGVAISFTTHGLESSKEFLEQVRLAVTRGLSREDALKALTITPATLFGLQAEYGSIAKGKSASFIVADGDIFEEKSSVVETWVRGQRFVSEDVNSKPILGDWKFVCSGLKPEYQQTVLQLEKSKGKLTGTILPNGVATKPKEEKKKKSKPALKEADDESEISLDEVGFDGQQLSGTFDGEKLGLDGKVRFTVLFVETEKTQNGLLIIEDGSKRTLRLSKMETENKAGEGTSSDANEDTAGEEVSKKDDEKITSFPINYPLGEFGVLEAPTAPELYAIKNAKIWTSSDAGIIENGTLLIGNGEILAIGKDIELPEGTVIFDGTGLEVTPGIIDCHSHMATDGGVNESGQAIVAEVRIGDFIDCNDINIYRQLAGGVTAANILHGSANPIGGQNQVIKLRWGGTDSELKMTEAPAGIKFALGENVKQANWGDKFKTRYPQTRMGVEQLMRDAFSAARRYDEEKAKWDATHEGLPPRRDLELEAVAEIVRGERWIHCHSYRQDEILALLRTTAQEGIRIGTLQHILEGYKVADEIAEHGVMASAFADWWAYKLEVFDAIPYAGSMLHKNGVIVSFNSDDREMARRLNQEAAKAVRYGGVSPEDALKFVTLNPAKQLRIDQYVGSLEVGKQADFVIWSGDPLSTQTRCLQTWIDGRKYFDVESDLQARKQVELVRSALIEEILKTNAEIEDGKGPRDDSSGLWPREDEYCHMHLHPRK